MNSTQTQAATKTKPTLHGVKIKQRKGIQKAQAKHEPEVFRDNLLSGLQSVSETDFETILAKLDKAGDTLEYSKYGTTLAEILIVGGILRPGGVVDKNKEFKTFSIFDAQDDTAIIRKHVDLFYGLARRFKFLPKFVEETLKNILKNVNVWKAEENSKLAKATAFLIAMNHEDSKQDKSTLKQLIKPTMLEVLVDDSLVKDGNSLEFATILFQTLLSMQTIEQFSKTLKSCKLESRLIDLFPPKKHTDECLASHFEAHSMGELIVFYKQQQKKDLVDSLTVSLSEMIITDESEFLAAEDSEGKKSQEFSLKDEAIILHVVKGMKEIILSERNAVAKKTVPTMTEVRNNPEVVAILWNAILSTMNTMNPRREELMKLDSVTDILGVFTDSPKSEMTLLKQIQGSCTEHASLTPFFRDIVEILYNADVLSDTAIIYWAEKVYKPSSAQSKDQFLEQINPLVQKLKEEEDDDDE